MTYFKHESAYVDEPCEIGDGTSFGAGSIGAAIANAAIIPLDAYGPALGARFMTGVFLAAVYPPALKACHPSHQPIRCGACRHMNICESNSPRPNHWYSIRWPSISAWMVASGSPK